MQPFSAWKVGATYYAPAFLFAAVFMVLAVRGHRWAWIAFVPCAAFALFSLFFFRDPLRTITAGPNDVVSPADGTVIAVDELKETSHYSGPCKRVTIFLSIFSVHVNRAPFDGTVRDIRRGGTDYLFASKPEAGERNVFSDLWMDTPRGPMTVRQITGLVARRIVCPAKVGDRLEKGQKFGMIKFGSRTELYLPLDAQPCVKPGDKVGAGTTTVARFQ